MDKRQELNEALLTLGKGLNSILMAATENLYSKEVSSLSEYRNQKEIEIIEKVMNGETEEGYAQNRYAKTFKYSFDEEVAAFDEFLYAFTGRNFDSAGIEGENIKCVLLGFEHAGDALAKIVELVEDDKDLKGTLREFTWIPEEGAEPRNLFADSSPYLFDSNFRGWARAFKKELRESIGQYKYYQYKKSIEQTS